MQTDIAVLLNEKFNLAAIDECKIVRIYRKANGLWHCESEFASLIDFSDAETLRASTRALIESSGCKIILGTKINGIPYHIFDKYGIHIFEAPELSDTLLNRILEEIQTQQEDQLLLEAVHKVPFSPDKDGIYYLDLIALQKSFPEISSKAALQNFMNNAIFYRLELLCSHLPPWMEQVMEQRNLECTEEKISDHSIKAVIRSKGCEAS